MREARSIEDYLNDILDASGKAIHFIESVGFKAFAEDSEKIFAVERALEIIGEAAKKIPKKVRDKYPAIPWRSISGMRDKLTHEYFGIHLHRIWLTVREDIPPLAENVKIILEDLKNK